MPRTSVFATCVRWASSRAQSTSVASRVGHESTRALLSRSPSRWISRRVPVRRTIQFSDWAHVGATHQVGQPLPRAHCEMSNRTLLIYAARNDTEAIRELLTREIMAVDNVSWEGAQSKLEEMDDANKEGMGIALVPYKIGVCVSITAAAVTFPLTYDLDTVLWFNHHYVTADLADPEDLETWLEVGKWSWEWMGPPIDQLSFLLLCAAYARNQMFNLGLKPYSGMLRKFRSNRLRRRFPQYSPRIVHDFAVNYGSAGSEKFIPMTNEGDATTVKPTLEVAKALPRSYVDMTHDDLLFFAAFDNSYAIRELLIREVMAVDKVSWDDAQATVDEIHRTNKEGMLLATLPYTVGTFLSLTAGLLSIPLLYHLDSVLWFNHHFVTTPVAEAKDLETVLEVAKWAWAWMSVPFGQLSFLLLCFAFARGQMLNIGMRPYSGLVRSARSWRLRRRYPAYNPRILHDFSVNTRLI